MQKLMIAAIGLSLGMGVAATAMAQSMQTPGQMQAAPETSGDNSTMSPPAPSASMAPATSAMPGDMPSGAMSSGSMSSGGPSSGNMSSANMPAPPASYPRCSATVHDECRQHK